MATSLGDLFLELGIDATKYERQMREAERRTAAFGQRLESRINKLTVNVDDRQLGDLNEHLDLKVKHHRQVQDVFELNPLTVKVDDRALTTLNERLSALRSGETTVTTRISDTPDFGRSDREGGGANTEDLIRAVDALPEKIADAIAPKAKERLGGAASKGVGFLGNITDGLFQGLAQGFTQEITRPFGQGLSEALEGALGKSVGSSQLLGRNLGEAIAMAVGDALPPVLKDKLSTAASAIVPEMDRRFEALAKRAKVRGEELQKRDPARDQATRELQGSLRSYQDLRGNSDRTNQRLTVNRRTYARGEALQTGLRAQLPEATEAESKKIESELTEIARYLEELAEEESKLIEWSAQLAKDLGQARLEIASARDNVNKLSPVALPEVYRRAVQEVAGDIDESKIPRLLVDDAALEKKGAQGEYGIESNTIRITSEMNQALEAGMLTLKQLETIYHELQHSVQFDFGSARGVQARKENRILNKAVMPTTEEYRDIAPFISQYKKEERTAETDAYVMGRRNSKAAFGRQQSESARDRLYNVAGYDGGNIEASLGKDISGIAVTLSTMRRLADQAGLVTVEGLDELAEAVSASMTKLNALVQRISSSERLDSAGLASVIESLGTQFEEIEKIKGSLLSVKKGMKGQLQDQAETERSIENPWESNPLRKGQIAEYINARASRFKDKAGEIAEDPWGSANRAAGAVGTASGNVYRRAKQDIALTGQMAQLLGQEYEEAKAVIGAIASSTPAKAFIGAVSQATAAMTGVAQFGYQVASGVEAVALDVLPMGRAAKGVLQQTAVPAATFGAAAHFLPGGEMAAGWLMDAAQSAAGPVGQSIGAAGSGVAGDIVGAVVPNIMGLQNAVASGLGGLIDGAAATAASAIAQGGAAVMGGKAIQVALSSALPELEPVMLPPALPAAVKQNVKQIEATVSKAGKSADKATKEIAAAVRPLALPPASLGNVLGKADALTQQATKNQGALKGAIAALDKEATETNRQIAEYLAESIVNATEQAGLEIDAVMQDASARGEDVSMGSDLGNRLNNRKSQLAKKQKAARRQLEILRGSRGNDSGEELTQAQLIPKTPVIDTAEGNKRFIEFYRQIVDQVAELSGISMQLADIPQVIIAADDGSGIDGKYSASDNNLYITDAIAEEIAKGNISEAVVDVLVHELRHGVQAAFGKSNFLSEKRPFSRKESGIDLLVPSPSEKAGMSRGVSGSVSNYISNEGIKNAKTVRAIEEDAYTFSMRNTKKIQSRLSTPDVEELTQAQLDLGRAGGNRSRRGLAPDDLEELKQLDELLRSAEDSADRFDSAYKRLDKTAKKAFDDSNNGLLELLGKLERGEEIEGFDGKLSKVAKTLGGLLENLLGFVAVGAISGYLASFSAAAIDVAIELESVQARLVFLSDSAREATDDIRQLFAEAKAAGTDVREDIGGFTRIKAAAKDTELEGFAGDELFEAGRQAGQVFQLTPERQASVYVALEQMISKGNVSAEELRQQLGEHLPGAFQIAARSIGVTTAELNKMLERGEVISSEFLPRFAQQLKAETYSGLAGAADTTQAAMNRLQTGIVELQSTVGAQLLPAKKLGLNQAAALLEVVSNNIGRLMSTLTAAALLFAGPFVASLVKALVKLHIMPAALKMIRGGLLATGASIMAFTAKMILIEAAFVAAQIAYQLFSESAGEIGGIAEESGRGLDQLIKQLNGVENASKKARDGLKAEGFIGEVTKETKLTKNVERTIPFLGEKNPINRFLGFNFGGFAYDKLANKQIRNQSRDRSEASGELAGQAAQTSRLANSYLSGENRKVLDEYIALEEQLKKIQVQQQAVRATRPGSTEELEMLVKQEQTLISRRGDLVDEVMSVRGSVDERSQFVQAGLDSLKNDLDSGAISYEDYRKEVARLKPELETLTKAQGGFNTELEQASSLLSQIARNIEDVMDRYADLGTEIGRQEALALADVSADSSLSPAQRQSAGQAISQSSTANRLQANQAAVEQIRAQLATPTFQTSLSALGIADYSAVGSAQAARLGERTSNSPQLKEAAVAIQQLRELETEAAQLQQQIGDAAASSRDELKAASRSVEDFFRSIEQEAQQLANSAELSKNELGMAQVTTRIQGAVMGVGESFIEGFGDSLIAIVEAFNKPLQDALNANQQKADAQLAYFNTQLQSQDLLNSLPGGVDVSGYGGAGGGGGGDGKYAPFIAGKTFDQINAYNPTAGQSFTAPRRRRSGPGRHNGTDYDRRIGAGEGGQINAIADGQVSRLVQYGVTAAGEKSIAVFYEFIDSLGKKIEVAAGHLSESSVRQALGIDMGSSQSQIQSTRVRAGRSIGRVGADDSVSDGAHLDLKIKVNGNYVDPEAFFRNPGNAPRSAPQQQAPARASASNPTRNAGFTVPSGLTAEGRRMAQYLNNPNILALLDTIAMAEMGPSLLANNNGFSTGYGGRNIPSLRQHPYNGRELTPSGESTASGRYQFMGDVWAEVADQLGLSDFSPGAQTLAAIKKLDYRGILDEAASGDINGAWRGLGREWAAFEGNPYGQGTPLGRRSSAIPYFQQQRQLYASGAAAPVNGASAGGAGGVDFAEANASYAANSSRISEANALALNNLNATRANIDRQLETANILSAFQQRQTQRQATQQLDDSNRSIEERERGSNRRLIDLSFDAMPDTPDKRLQQELENLRRTFEDDTADLSEFNEQLENSLIESGEYLAIIAELQAEGLIPPEFAQELIEKLSGTRAVAEGAFNSSLAKLSEIGVLYQDIIDMKIEEAARAEATRAFSVRQETESLDAQIGRAQIPDYNRRGYGAEALSLESEFQRLAVELEFDEKIRELEELERTGQRTAEEVQVLTAKYQELGDLNIRGIARQLEEQQAQLAKAQKSELFNSENTLYQSVMKRYEIYGGSPSFDSDPFAEKLAIAQQEMNFASQIEEMEKLADAGTLAGTALEQVRQNLELANQVEIGNIKAQFDAWTPVLGIAKDGMQGLIGDLIQGGKSIGEIFSGMLASVGNALAQLAAKKITEGLFGSIINSGNAGGGGGFLGTILKSVFNFSEGVDEVPEGDFSGYRKGMGPISEALVREGPNSVLAALSPGERVLTVAENKTYPLLIASAQRRDAMGINKVVNFKRGGVVGAPPPAVPSADNLSTTINLGAVNLNVGGGGLDAQALQQSVEAGLPKIIEAEIIRQQSVRGRLYN